MIRRAATPGPGQITVTHTRSTIGVHKRKYREACLRVLGLGRIGRSRTLEDTPAIRGIIAKVAHLVSVTEYRPVETRSRRGKPVQPRRQRAYIWEQDEWPELTWDPEPLQPLQERLIDARTALRTRFEALILDVGERQLIADEISQLLSAPPEQPNVAEVMRDATTNHAMPINKERICAWHRELFPDGKGDGREIITGDWRRPEDDPMVVEYQKAMGKSHIHFEAPPAHRIPDEAERLFKWIERTAATDPILAPGIAHIWLLTIHPFDNGNGRIARAITETLLARAGDNPLRLYSIASQIQTDRHDYDLTIEAAQKDECDITGWLKWFMNCELRAIESAETRLGPAHQRHEFRKRFPENALNPRQAKIIEMLLHDFKGKLTTKKWATMNKCPHDQAQRDIDELIERGALKPQGSGKSTSYALIL